MLRLNLIILLLSFASPVSASVVQMYGAESTFPSRFYGVNVSNGALALIGTSNSFLAAMDFSPSGILYAASSAIEEVNPLTGLRSNRRALNFIGGPSPSDILTGLTFSPSGDLYGIGNGNGNIWRVDLATANAQFIGSSPTSAFSLEFGPGGKLYSAGFNLHEVDPLTGNATLIGRILPPSQVGSIMRGLDFAADGVLYGATANGLYTIDVSTGVGSLIGTTGGNLGSIASRPGAFNVVPEPSGLAIWSLGLMIGLPWYRSRKFAFES